MDDAETCATAPGDYRIFRAMLSTTEVSAISRVPERAEPWIDITRHPLTRTGPDLAAGLTLTGFRDPGFKPLIGGRDYAFVGFARTPSELAARGEFPHTVVNDDIDRAAAELAALIRSDG